MKNKKAEPTVREIRSGSSLDRKDHLIDTLITEVSRLNQELLLAKQIIGAQEIALAKIYGHRI